MTRKMDLPSCSSSTEVRFLSVFYLFGTHSDTPLSPGHTARPTDFCWAPGETENWTAASVSEDNVVMVWQPTMRVWASEQVHIDDKELEGDAMEGVESTLGAGPSASGTAVTGSATGTSVSGDD
jgi:histone-binding protein RBBP4